MPNNFKLQGDYYVSKFGNDSWDGLTPDTPKRTVQAGLNLISTANKTLVIGAGTYSETLIRTFGGGSNNTTIVADGTVLIINPNSFIAHQFYAGSAGNPVINFRNIFFSQGSLYHLATNNNAPQLYFYDCKFSSMVLTGGQPSGTSVGGADGCQMIRCILINTNITISRSSSQSITGFNSCVVYNCTISPQISTWDPISIIINSYISKSNIRLFSSISTSNFNYNNIQSTTIIMTIPTVLTSNTPVQDIYGRWYNPVNAGSGGDGTIGNPYGRALTANAGFDYPNHRILYPTYNVNSISEDPKFNDILAQDFTLQSGSPHIGRAFDGINNIGGTLYAIRAAANSSSFSGSGATVDAGLTFSYDNYVISGSAVTGSVASAPIFISSSAKVIQDIEYNGLLAFNKTTSSFFSSANVNVPDFDTYTSASGNPGANPDRLVYYMRLTTGSTQPVVDADWDNGNLWTRGDYNVFEWNTKPSIDIYGRGNGDPNFVVANSSFLRATYIQMKVKLRNDYLQ